MFISSIKKSKTKIVVSILAPILLFFSLLFSSSAYAAVPQTTTQTPPGGPIANEDGTTCAVEKVGWFVCPIVESSAKIGDNMFSFLADNFLQTEPALISSGDGNGTKTAWELARNTANILFIIVFIIVIYSQITSTGLSNYGIKRMMPRLIIVAIAMNLSYLICQLVVDLTNTLGYAIMDWLVSLSHTVFSQSIMPVQTPGTNNVTDVSLLGTMATVAIASAVVWMLIGPLIGTIGLIVATCIAIVVILLLRKTFIILLVVVSPLAFVAYLLPNTEKLFSKWLNMFWKLLLVFPIVAMLMGGGQLASAIILASGHSAGYGENAAYKAKGEPCVYLDPAMKDEKCEDGEGPGIMLALVAAGVAVAPLLAVFAVMKGALAAAGAIGGKIAQGIQKGSNKGVSGAEGKYKNSGFAKNRAEVKAERNARVAAGSYTGSNPIRQRRSSLNRALNKSAAFNKVTSGYGAKRDLMSQALNRKDTKDVMEMIGHDDKLASAWANQNTSGLDVGQQEQYQKMLQAGHHKKSSSFLAAASLLSENGKGSAADVNAAIDKAGKAGASLAEQSGAKASAIVNYRKSGRADNLAALTQPPGVAPADHLRDTFSQISASSVNHSMFGDNLSADATQHDTAEQARNRSAYTGYLTSNKANTESALRGWSQMDPRTQHKIQSELVAAAVHHGAAPGGTIQDAKNHFNIS